MTSQNLKILPQNMTILGLNGVDTPVSSGEMLARIAAARLAVVAPFSQQRVDLVARVSDKLLGRGSIATSSFIKHFAFWIRRGALRQLAAGFEKRLPQATLARPRGVVFHLPPQNVETVFLYSWILSYLVGNANITRAPTEFGGAVRSVCEMFLEQLEAAGDDSQFFVQYSSTSPLNAILSAESDARIVWGGDAKVGVFAPMPLRNGGKAIWFGDRSSFSVMKGEAIGKLDDGARLALAQRLYNDIFIFDQMACSSPHVLFIVGESDRDRPAVAALMEAVSRLALAADQTAGTGHFMRKMVVAFQAAAGGGASAIEWRNPALTTVLSSPDRRHEERVGGGFLWVDFIDSLAAIRTMARERDQTVTHFGFSAEEVAELADAVALSGVSRLAPVGAALDFDSIWDGYDIPFELTRLVRVN
jgi:hypothetical protein